MENHIKVNLSSVQNKSNIRVNINAENKNHINTSLQQASVNITKVEGEKDDIVVIGDYNKPVDSGININEILTKDSPQIAEIIQNKADKSEIPTKVSQLQNDVGYLTKHQDLSEYAKLTDLPEVPTVISAFENDAGYLTAHQNLEEYAKKAEIPTKVSELTNDTGYLTKAELPPEYDDTEIKNRLNTIESKEANWDAKQDSLEPDIDYVTPGTLGSYVTTTQLDNAILAVENEIPELPDWIEDTKPTYTYDEVGADPEGAADEVQGNLDEHTKNDSIHVTNSDKTIWNNKVSDVKINGKSVISETEANITEFPVEIITGLSDVATSGQYADLNGRPEALPNPNSLKFGSSYYNGSESAEITAASIGAATESFVNSSIATNTAYFRGTYNITEDLGLNTDATDEEISNKLAEIITEVTNNDYTFVYYYAEIPVVINDNSPVDKYRRFKYDSFTLSWQYEYELNNSSFTDAQWKAITSGITSELVTQIGTNSTAIENTNTTLSTHVADFTGHITANERSTWNAKQNALIAGTDYVTPSGLSGTLESYATTEDLETVEGKIPTQPSQIGAASVNDLQTTATNLNNHTGNLNVHLQAGERAEWDGKVSDVQINGTSIKGTNNIANITTLPANLIAGLSAVATSGSIEDIEDAPKKLPNPAALKFGNSSYDGSSEQTITAGTIGAATTQALANVQSQIPNVPNWALQSTKPTYNFSEVQAGTISKELIVNGGDADGGGKIVLIPDDNNGGQITASGTNTLFGFTSKDTLVAGHKNYTLKLRGRSTNPTYNDKGIMLLSGIGQQTVNANTTTTSSKTDTPLVLRSSSGKTEGFIGFKDGSGTTLGYFGVNANKKPVFYDSQNRGIVTADDNTSYKIYPCTQAQYDAIKASPPSDFATTIYMITG